MLLRTDIEMFVDIEKPITKSSKDITIFTRNDLGPLSVNIENDISSYTVYEDRTDPVIDIPYSNNLISTLNIDTDKTSTYWLTLDQEPIKTIIDTRASATISTTIPYYTIPLRTMDGDLIRTPKNIEKKIEQLTLLTYNTFDNITEGIVDARLTMFIINDFKEEATVVTVPTCDNNTGETVTEPTVIPIYLDFRIPEVILTLADDEYITNENELPNEIFVRGNDVYAVMGTADDIDKTFTIITNKGEYSFRLLKEKNANTIIFK